MSSTIRIVQSGLRPTRKDENNLEKLAKLIIPVILDEHFINNERDSYCFKKLRQIIAEMSISDNNILDRIKYFEAENFESLKNIFKYFSNLENLDYLKDLIELNKGYRDKLSWDLRTKKIFEQLK